MLGKIFSRRRSRPPQSPKLSEKAQHLIEILRSRAKNGQVEISQAELAKLTGWTDRTVRTYLKEARDVGVLQRVRRPNRPDVYRLTDRKIVSGPASLGRSRSPSSERADRGVRNPPGVSGSDHDHDGLLGREEALVEVERLVAKGANVLITGFDGMGKTHLLKHLSQDGIGGHQDVLLHFSTPSPAKEFLLNLAEEIQHAGELEADEDLDLEKLKVRELFKLVRGSLAGSRKRFLLLIDDLDQITPTQKPMFQELLELRNVQVIATAKTEKPRYSSLWHHFFKVELKGIPKEASDRLVEEFLEEKAIPIEPGLEHRLKERLYRKSRGNPRELLTLLRKIEIQGYVDRAYLREELGAEEEHGYIDMTWVVIMTAAIIMAARYLGLGLHDRGLYILAGVSYGAMILIRWLSYRWRR